MFDYVQIDTINKSSQIVERCTRDANESDVHVVPMGTSGDMFPYFQPNCDKCRAYVENLNEEYNKVVPIIPTGWANAPKWNKEHDVS